MDIFINMDYDYDDFELPEISFDCSSLVARRILETVESPQPLSSPVQQEHSGDSSPGLQELENAAALAAAIADLVVIHETVAPDFLLLLREVHEQLPVTVRGFISSYLEAAGTADDRCSKALYQEIISNIISIVACPSNVLRQADIISASAWLMCACASMRIGVNAMQTMQYLLNHIATKDQVLEVCRCIQRCEWDATTLLRVSDSVRGPAGGEGGLAANILLRAAAAVAYGHHVSDAAPASVEEVTAWAQRGGGASPAREEGAEGAPRGAEGAPRVAGGAPQSSEAARLAAVWVVGRLLAHCAATDHQREALLATFTRKSRPHKIDAHKVALGVSRLNLVFKPNKL